MKSRTKQGQSREELAERFVVLQKRLWGRLRDDMPAEVRESMGSITAHQLDAMRALGKGPLTMSGLAAAMGTTSMSSMTQLADRMVKQGLVERQADPNDRRIVRLAISAGTRETVASFLAAQRRAVLETFDRLDGDELATLMELLEKLAGDAEAGCARPA